MNICKTKSFKRCHFLGLYPVVDRFAWVEKLLAVGVKSIQLRIKEKTDFLETEIIKSIALAQKYEATLFINDHWELALRYGAKGIHLGQADLANADITAIHRAGLLLGLSAYCEEEIERAASLHPSYIAFGPIYPTTSKILPVEAQGIQQLRFWQRRLPYPLVAIGGITLARYKAVLATGVCGIALISAITKAANPEMVTKTLLAFER